MEEFGDKRHFDKLFCQFETNLVHLKWRLRSSSSLERLTSENLSFHFSSTSVDLFAQNKIASSMNSLQDERGI